MKILLVSQYFWPETFRINDLVEEFISLGHNVTVLTGKPNYPQGKIYDGYEFLGYVRETYKGAKVIRVPLIPRGKGNGFMLAINYFSFVFFSCLYIFTHRDKYDVSLTFAISPITQVYAALLHKRMHNSKAYLWVQDLWPDSIVATGKLKSKVLYNLISKMVGNIYKNVDGICLQSEAFYESILAYGINKNKLSYIPNWAENIFIEKYKIDFNKYNSLIPKGFVVMFAGNIGEAQDFDSIIKAAYTLRGVQNIKWIVVGDGRKKEYVSKKIKELKLEQSFFLLGQYSLQEMPNLFIHADVMLVSLKNEHIFSLTIPSKIQSYMAFGKPIVSMLNGVGKRIILDSNCGLAANAGDHQQLAENIIFLSNKENTVLKNLGNNGIIYYRKHFSRNKIIKRLFKVIQK